MALKGNTKQVEQLALVPVGARDDAGDAGRLAVGARLEAEPGVLGERIEEVDELEALLAREQVHGGQIDKARVIELLTDRADGLDEVHQGHADRGNGVRRRT